MTFESKTVVICHLPYCIELNLYLSLVSDWPQIFLNPQISNGTYRDSEVLALLLDNIA